MENISFQSISDSRIPIAITDLKLTLQYGNKSLYTLIGNELFFSIYKVVLPADRSRLTDCIENISHTKKITDVFSILYSDNEYHHMLLNLTYIKNNKLIKIEFQYLSDILNEHCKLDFEIKKFRTLFTLDGDHIFEYHPDTNRFKFYWINDSQNILLFNGDFLIWKQTVLNRELVSIVDINIFMDLCQAIENGNKSFEYELTSGVLTDGEIFESTKVKGVTVKDHNSNIVVLGVWLLYNTICKVKENHFIDSLYKDEMTGLLNKCEIKKYIQNILRHNYDYPIYIFILDLDNFKQCNDTYGHMFGDDILRSVATIIKNTIQQNGVAGRIGGDEFLVVLENIESEKLLRSMLRTIRANIQWLYREKLSTFQLSCSMGVSCYPRDSKDYDTLFKLADYSLYLAKNKGKSRYIIYDYNMHGSVSVNTHDNSILTKAEPVVKVTTLSDLKKNIASVYSKGIDSIPELFDALKGFYDLHNISIYMADYMTNSNSLLLDYNFLNCFSSLFIKEYLEQFNETEAYCVTNIKNLEFTYNEIYEYFADKTSTSYYQCLLTDSKGTLRGIISYERSTVHNPWSNELLQLLSFVSSIVGSVALSE